MPRLLDVRPDLAGTRRGRMPERHGEDRGGRLWQRQPRLGVARAGAGGRTGRHRGMSPSPPIRTWSRRRTGSCCPARAPSPTAPRACTRYRGMREAIESGDRGRRSVPRHLRRHATDGRARAGARGHPGFGWISGDIAARCTRPACACRRWAGTRWISNRARIRCSTVCSPAITPISCTATRWWGAMRREVLATTDYGGPVVAIVAPGNRAGTQFHVEKSQEVGLRILMQLPALDALTMSTPAASRPPPFSASSGSRTSTDDDLHALCEATHAAIIEGGGFGWVHPPGERALESYYRGVLLVPERRALRRAALDGDRRRLGAARAPAAQQRGTGLRGALDARVYRALCTRPRARADADPGVEEAARQTGYHVLNLDVRETQAAAIRVYESLGFGAGACTRLRAGRRQDDPRLLLLQAAEASARGGSEPAGWMAADALPGNRPEGRACVRLRQGEMDQATVYSDDPAAQARRWQRGRILPGCTWSISTAPSPARPVNAGGVPDILAAVAIPVQLGGGIRDMAGIETWLAAGVRRVILGSAAAKTPALVQRGLPRISRPHRRRHRRARGPVATEGWAEPRPSTRRSGAAVRGCRRRGDHLHRHQPRRHADRAEPGATAALAAPSVDAGDRLRRRWPACTICWRCGTRRAAPASTA